MLVFSDLSIQLLINWLGRCATAFDSEHVILTSASRWALDLGVEALSDLYLMGRQLSGLLGLGREQSFNQKGTWQRQLGESRPHGAHGKSTLAASPGKRPARAAVSFRASVLAAELSLQPALQSGCGFEAGRLRLCSRPAPESGTADCLPLAQIASTPRLAPWSCLSKQRWPSAFASCVFTSEPRLARLQQPVLVSGPCREAATRSQCATGLRGCGAPGPPLRLPGCRDSSQGSHGLCLLPREQFSGFACCLKIRQGGADG